MTSTRMWALALALGATVGTASPLAAAEGSLFSVDPGLIIWTWVVFLSLFTALRFVAWKPLLAALESRRARIQGDIDEAAQLNADAARLLEENKAQLADARRQAQEILSESKEQGERIRREIEEKARVEGQELLERARQEIERERDAALDTLRKESVDLAMAAAEQLVGKKMDDSTDRQLVSDFLQQVSRSEAQG